MTTWLVADLEAVLPKAVHSSLRLSRYYVKGSDSISITSQTSRQQSENAKLNLEKLYSEIEDIYKQSVPRETSAEWLQTRRTR